MIRYPRRYEAAVEVAEDTSPIELISYDDSEGVLLVQGEDQVYVHDGEQLDKLILALQLYQTRFGR